MRLAPTFLCGTFLLLSLLGWFAAGPLRDAGDRGLLRSRQALVRTLGLTDLSIWTEARYTRHPSQADVFSPHQDLPSSLEHFPAGSLVGPPPAALSGSSATAR